MDSVLVMYVIHRMICAVLFPEMAKLHIFFTQVEAQMFKEERL